VYNTDLLPLKLWLDLQIIRKTQQVEDLVSRNGEPLKSEKETLLPSKEVSSGIQEIMCIQEEIIQFMQASKVSLPGLKTDTHSEEERESMLFLKKFLIESFQLLRLLSTTLNYSQS
jgi:hypothetical protein